MKTKVKGLLAFLLVFAVQIAFAQTKTVSGLVSDQDGAPLPGATVLVKGTNKGTTSDFDGNFSISAAQGDVLVFSFIGYVTKEVSVGNSSQLNVTLAQDAQALEEVIVTGFGDVSKKSFAGSKQRGGYAQYQNNLPITPAYQVAGVTLPASQLGLANPPPITTLSNCVNCIDNMSRFPPPGTGFPSKGH